MLYFDHFLTQGPESRNPGLLSRQYALSLQAFRQRQSDEVALQEIK